MGTIFEHDVTKLEIEMLTSCALNKTKRDKDKYLKFSDIDTSIPIFICFSLLETRMRKPKAIFKN